MATTTKHTCGGPAFGRKTPGCPRCDELLAGAAPVVWNITLQPQAPYRPVQHDCRTAGCGVVCTHGDW